MQKKLKKKNNEDHKTTSYSIFKNIHKLKIKDMKRKTLNKNKERNIQKKQKIKFHFLSKSDKQKSKKEKKQIMRNDKTNVDHHMLTVEKVDVLTKDVIGKDKNNIKKLIDLHLDTIYKVDNLLKEVKEAANKSQKRSGFIKKNFFSDKSNQTNLNGDRSPFPEFLSTTPFERYHIDWDFQEKNSDISEENDNIMLDNNNDIETKMAQGQDTILVPPEEESTKIETNDSYDNPYPSEIIVEEKEKTSKPIDKKKKNKQKWIFTGIAGFDCLLEKGIPTGSNIIVAGGPGCGKTIFCLQTIYNKAYEGKDCVFLSMEERPDRLRDHMSEFGFKFKEIQRSEDQIILKVNGKGRISLKRLQPIRLARSIEALLEKASGTLPVDINLVLDFIPEDFDACLLTLDSISAIETAFSGTKRQYRIYIEQLFRYFEHLDITAFMITESSEAPKRFSSTGVEEFLADGIFVFYNFQGVKKRTRGVEIYKLRGASHSQKIVPMTITSNGILITSEDTCKEQST